MEAYKGQENNSGDGWNLTNVLYDCDIDIGQMLEVDGNSNVTCTVTDETDRNMAISEFAANLDGHQLQTLEVRQEPQPLNNINAQDKNTCIAPITWEEVFSITVFPVRCKDTNAELYKSKFASGRKGKCIKMNDQWFTPNEFEVLCGRGNSKDWKRSIRFGGRPLQALVQIGCLMPHAFSCICSKCVDDSSPTVPIRHFSPYQRKRRNLQQGDASKSKLSKDSTLKTCITDESVVVGTSSSTNPLTQVLNKISQPTPPTTEEAWSNLQDMVEKIVQASLVMNKMVKDTKEQTHQEIESLKSQLQEQQKVLQSIKQQQTQITIDGIAHNLINNPEFVRALESHRTRKFSIKVVNPETIKQLQASQPSTFKSEPEGQR